MIGAGGDRYIFGRMLHAVTPRGDAPETLLRDGLLAGTHRALSADDGPAVQPWCSPDGEWLLCLDGAVFNHVELRAELQARGHEFQGESETEVVLAAFRHWGDEAAERLVGEWALALVQRRTGRAYLARDPLGVKPLYWSTRAGRLHIGSEIKALVPVDARIREVPPGHHGWAEPAGAPELRPYFDLPRLDLEQPAITDPWEAANLVQQAIWDSIAVRVPTRLPVGVLLSGGVGSALTLLTVRSLHPGCVAFSVGTPDGDELADARRLTSELGIPHEIVELRPSDIGYDEVREAVRVGELTEYRDIIDAIVAIPLYRRVHDCGIRVVLTGDGSTALFGGAPRYQHASPERARELLLHKLTNLGRTELHRVDRTSMSQGVQARVPFLDPTVVELAMRLPMELRTHAGQDKWVIREGFADVLPAYIRERVDSPVSYSAGLHERARLFKPLFARLHRSFGYDLLEPVRRDFDAVLLGCGNDLDKALAEQAARQDYTLGEHARDFAGALEWNTRPLRRKLTGTR